MVDSNWKEREGVQAVCARLQEARAVLTLLWWPRGAAEEILGSCPAVTRQRLAQGHAVWWRVQVLARGHRIFAFQAGMAPAILQAAFSALGSSCPCWRAAVEGSGPIWKQFHPLMVQLHIICFLELVIFSHTLFVTQTARLISPGRGFLLGTVHCENAHISMKGTPFASGKLQLGTKTVVISWHTCRQVRVGNF